MTDPLNSPTPARSWEGSRLQGVLITVVGVVAGYFSIVMPLQQAFAQAPEISWAGQYAFLSPPLILLGILAIIWPSMTTNKTFLLKAKDKLSVQGWIVVVALAALGAGTALAVNHQLTALGYTDQHLSVGGN
ncbi:MAG: hypothetical protein KGL66_10920 [Alphaproteobacteria bacterium]|nr:hypothetical protein [Alphaproteobacteria bacterium]MDE2352393.1 hypothetical protein [Alphaproteobacteria bacterium]